ncbi:MAG: amidase, partial [Chitinophagaceae bacterium]|nr:amidase [Chitinophagaceae bacterium]
QGRGDWPNGFRSARFIPAVDYINANRHRFLLMQKMDEFIRQYDVVIFPTFSGSQLAITNLTGHPAICMPTGFNKNNLPTSITLVGKLYDEATLLAIAKAYQHATQWDEMHPEIFKK